MFRLTTAFKGCATVAVALIMAAPASGQFDECPNPKGGDCFEATPGIGGCTDEECCNTVCDADPACCILEWDDVCVNLAIALCEGAGCVGCGGPGCGDCFANLGVPFCNDECDGVACEGCCDSVCAVDPFCCDVFWDQICADEAVDICGCDPEEAPINDLCADALPIFLGATDYSTLCAGTDGPMHEVCDQDPFFPDPSVGLDIWFDYVADFTGGLRITTCDTADYNSKMAVYEGCDCPVGEENLIACNDNGLKCADGTGATIDLAVESGQCYKIRLGGYIAASGTGTIILEPAGPPSNDNCDSAIGISLGDTSVFNTAAATTDGEADAACDNNGDDQIENDVWFKFSSAIDGDVQVSTCGSATDTKIAVYASTDCPPGVSPVACADDGCGDQASLIFSAANGQSYLIRVGNPTDQPGGSGVVGISQFATCPEDTVLLDQIGPDTSATTGQAVFASQIFEPANTPSDIASLDDFDVPAGGATLSCLDAVGGGFNGFTSPNDITNYRVEFYSSPEAAANSLTGDVASVASADAIVVTTFDMSADHYLVNVDLSNENITLGEGTYWVALIPELDFGAFGQSAISASTIGDDPNAYQANPNGGFGFPDNLQQIDPPANLAYRVIAGGGGGCVGDIDQTGDVDPSDLILLLGSWSVEPGSCPGCPADLDGDDDVDGNDLILLLGNWGPCP